MIYVTGDTHRDFERIYDFCEEIGTTQEDIMIVLGDAMINYYPEYIGMEKVIII